MKLQCPRCARIRTWSREEEPGGPGHCYCKTYQYWKVVPDNYGAPEGGYVRLITDKGSQNLRPPYYTPHPDRWQSPPPRGRSFPLGIVTGEVRPYIPLTKDEFFPKTRAKFLGK